LATAYRDWNAVSTILLLACWLAIVSANCRAQNQQNPQPVAPESSQQNEAKPNQSPENQSPQDQTPKNTPQPIQPLSNQSPPDQVPQNEPTQEEKKEDNPSPAQEAEDKTKQVTHQAAETTKKLGEVTFTKVRDWENGWLTGPYVSKERKLVSMTAQQREQIYLQQTLTTPSAYLKRMFVAGVDQLRDSPSGWPEGWGGYGERFASREGQFIIANSLAALGNAALKYEPRYDQCKCSGFVLRTRHAILRNFVTYDQSEQVLHPQWALYGGSLGGGLISTAWKPHPRSLLANGGYAVLGQAGYGALLNFFTEFAGDINRKLGAKKKPAKEDRF
jgi:flagellar motor protein MotB